MAVNGWHLDGAPRPAYVLDIVTHFVCRNCTHRIFRTGIDGDGPWGHSFDGICRNLAPAKLQGPVTALPTLALVATGDDCDRVAR